MTKRPRQTTASKVPRSDHSYAAKLLFQFRVVHKSGKSNRRRLVEERIVLFEADGAKKALATAKRHGRAGEVDYLNDRGEEVRFEFVGVLDLRHLDVGYEPNEVWYDIKHQVTPMERRAELLPSDSTLLEWAI